MGMYSLVVMVAQLASPMAWLEKEKETGEVTQTSVKLRGLVESIEEEDRWKRYIRGPERRYEIYRIKVLTWTSEEVMQPWELRVHSTMVPKAYWKLVGEWIDVTGIPGLLNGFGIERARTLWVQTFRQRE